MSLLLLTLLCGLHQKMSAAGRFNGAFEAVTNRQVRRDTSPSIGLVIDIKKVHQTIHSFGASDAWSTKFVGTWASKKKKEKIADLLFSLDTLKNGSPKGIGLSLWRFTIGAGSFGQGKASNINDVWRREECFLMADGSYDWSKEAGNQWFLRAARKRGVKYTLGFVNSPPIYMTKNGKAFSPGGIHWNLLRDEIKDYATFLAKVSAHFHLDYISPVNEPQWDWTAGGNGKASQEGSPATNDEIAELTGILSKKLKTQQSKTKIAIGEAAQWNFLYERNQDGRGDQINAFFSSASPSYIGTSANVTHAISAHSYFTTCPDSTLINTRKSVREKMTKVDPSLSSWMTEFGVLGDICGKLNGYPRHTGIRYGLYVAKVIHADLTIANVSSWQWWLAVNPYDYSDGLVYINDPEGNINIKNCRKDGEVLTSKQLWALGNYARFIRPGMKRVSVSVNGNKEPLSAGSRVLVSAYIDKNKKKLVLVIVNLTKQKKCFRLKEESSFVITSNTLKSYTTDRNRNLKKSVAYTDDIVIPSRSIVTLVGNYE